VFGILFAIALAGGMLVPWVAGRIGGAIGLRWVFAMVAVCFAAVLALSRVAARVESVASGPR
jgi:fucose permease